MNRFWNHVRGLQTGAYHGMAIGLGFHMYKPSNVHPRFDFADAFQRFERGKPGGIMPTILIPEGEAHARAPVHLGHIMVMHPDPHTLYRNERLMGIRPVHEIMDEINRMDAVAYVPHPMNLMGGMGRYMGIEATAQLMRDHGLGLGMEHAVIQDGSRLARSVWPLSSIYRYATPEWEANGIPPAELRDAAAFHVSENDSHFMPHVGRQQMTFDLHRHDSLTRRAVLRAIEDGEMRVRPSPPSGLFGSLYRTLGHKAGGIGEARFYGWPHVPTNKPFNHEGRA